MLADCLCIFINFLNFLVCHLLNLFRITDTDRAKKLLHADLFRLRCLLLLFWDNLSDVDGALCTIQHTIRNGISRPFIRNADVTKAVTHRSDSCRNDCSHNSISPTAESVAGICHLCHLLL